MKKNLIFSKICTAQYKELKVTFYFHNNDYRLNPALVKILEYKIKRITEIKRSENATLNLKKQKRKQRGGLNYQCPPVRSLSFPENHVFHGINVFLFCCRTCWCT